MYLFKLLVRWIEKPLCRVNFRLYAVVLYPSDVLPRLMIQPWISE